MKPCLQLDRCLNLRTRRVLGVVFGMLEMFCYGGIIFGFNALIPILKGELIYSYYCENPNSTLGCIEQNKMFGYAFTTYMVTQMFMLVFVGLLVDNMGLRLVKLFSAVVCCFGMFMFAFSTSELSWMIFPAGCCVSIGGMALLICDLSISKLFGKTSVVVLAIISGSHDAASSVFAIMNLLYEAGISHRLMFIVLGGSGCFLSIFSAIFVTSFWIKDMSNKPQKIDKKNVLGFGDDEKLKKIAFIDEEGEEENTRLSTLSSREADDDIQISIILHKLYPTRVDSLLSLPFVLITCFFCFGLLRFNFFLGQLSSLVLFHFNEPPQLYRLCRLLSFILAAGLIASICCGIIIDFLRSISRTTASKMSRASYNGAEISALWILISPQSMTMALVSCIALLLSCLVFVAEEWAYYINFCLFVLFRGFFFSSISSVILNGFPLEQFGTLYGISGTIAGVFSCLQYSMLLPPPIIGNKIAFSLPILMFITPVFVIYRAFAAFQQWKSTSSDSKIHYLATTCNS